MINQIEDELLSCDLKEAELRSAVAGAVEFIGKGLGIIVHGADVEEMGKRVICAEKDGIRPENFENYADYAQYIRGFEADRRWQVSEDDAFAAGIKLLVKDAEINHGLEPEMLWDMIGCVKHPYISSFLQEYSDVLTDCIQGNPDFLSDFCNYITGKYMDETTMDDVETRLAGMVKAFHPEMGDVGAIQFVETLRR